MYHSFRGWMYSLCIWLRAKAAGLTGWGTPETDSAHCFVTASFSNQIFSLAGGHKDPIVTQALVPWAQRLLVRARPNTKEDEI